MAGLDVSVVIVNWNTRDFLAACLRSIQQTAHDLNLEMIVVDNASEDGSQDMLRQEFPAVQLVQNQENVGFARANNRGAGAAQAEYILFFNSDAELQADSLQNMLKLIQNQPKAGMVGAQLLNPDGSFQASHSHFPTLWREFLILSGIGRRLFGRWHPSHGPEVEKGPQKVDYIEGACLLARKNVYQQIGGLDESFFMYAEEVDLCYRMRRAGWQVWYQPEARVVHYGGGSSQKRRTQREGDLYISRVHFFRKHYGAGAAWRLKMLIYTSTALKNVFHRTAQGLSHGRYGRSVISLQDLRKKMKGV
jgi:hypothetical protein